MLLLVFGIHRSEFPGILLLFDNLLVWVTFKLVEFCGFICCLFVGLLHLWNGTCGFCVFWLLVLVCAALVFCRPEFLVVCYFRGFLYLDVLLSLMLLVFDLVSDCWLCDLLLLVFWFLV